MIVQRLKYLFKIASLIIIMCVSVVIIANILGIAIDKEIEMQDEQALNWVDDLPIELRINP